MTAAKRRKVLEEWRLLPEAVPAREARSVGDLVDGQLAALGMTERLVEDQLADAWGEIEGAANASQSRPIQLKKGELIVAVAQPALKYNFERFHAGEILQRLQEQFGKGLVRSVRFKVGS